MVTTVKIMVNLKIYALYGKGESMKPLMDLEQKSSVAGLEWEKMGLAQWTKILFNGEKFVVGHWTWLSSSEET